VQAAGLGFKRVHQFSETAAVGTEDGQDPKAGARTKKSGTVTVANRRQGPQVPRVARRRRKSERRSNEARQAGPCGPDSVSGLT
jgi:hypothetical protein